MLGISLGTTYSHIRRLEKIGLIWRVPIRDGGGGAVAISRTGATWVRDEGQVAVFPKSQVPSTGEHARAVSWVATNYERRDGWDWLGRRSCGRTSTHGGSGDPTGKATCPISG